MMTDFIRKEHYKVEDLLGIMQILRGEQGCPWDREQDHHTIRNNLIEETYEVVEAIDTEDRVLLQEELGDLLLQVVFHSQMEQEQGEFNFDDVCNGICQKLILRHPHIFGDVLAKNSDEVLKNWENIKQKEKHQDTAASTLEAVSKALPSLTRSYKVQKRAAKVGFDHPNVAEALEHLKSEIGELEDAVASGSTADIDEELGDLLFSAVNVSRILKKDPEEALYRSTDKFISRFTAMEAMAQEQGKTLNQYTLDEQNAFWDIAKMKDY